MKVLGGVLAALTLAASAGDATASELWGGVYRHDIKDGVSEGDFEGGVQLAAGLRGPRLEGLRQLGRPSPYLTGSVNTDGGTNYLAGGLNWRLNLRPDARLYLRPGLGAAVHDGEVDLPSPYAVNLTDVDRRRRFDRGLDEIDLGARVLVHLDVALGWQASERVALEASWMHVSHGETAGSQNPGLSDVGLRVVYSLGGR